MKKKESVKGNKSLAKWHIIAVLAILFSLATIGVAAGQSVSISPASQSVDAGDIFTVDVTVDPAGNGVSSGSITVSFDATVMQADSAAGGDLLGASPLVPPGFPKIDNTNGTVQVDLARSGATTPPTAAGTFATITFTAKTGAISGTYGINLTSVGFADETFANIPGITITNGTVTVAGVSPPTPTVSIDQASQSVDAGDIFTVDVTVDPAGNGVSSGSITVSFDATVMQADSAAGGDLLGASPLVPPGFPKIDNTNGTVQVDLARSGATTPPTAAGTFATITFSVKSDATAGTYDIDLTSVGFVDETFADILGITINNGTVTVTTDTTAPVITSLNPADGSTTTDTTPTISASYSDPGSGINTSSVVLKLDGIDVTTTATVTASGVTYTPTAALSYATHTVILSVSDNANNPAATETWSFTVRRAGGGGGAYRPPVTMNVPVDPTTGEVATTTPLTTDKATLTITAGIIVKDAAGKPLSTSITMASTPTTAEKICAIAAYDFGPSGTTFSTPIDLVIAYDPADVPAGAELTIKMYDGTKWVDLPTTVDTVAHTATAKVSHFSIFALFAAAAPTATPTVTATAVPTAAPTAAPTATATPEPPGFEAVFGIAGMLAIAYLVLRRKRK